MKGVKTALIIVLFCALALAYCAKTGGADGEKPGEKKDEKKDGEKPFVVDERTNRVRNGDRWTWYYRCRYQDGNVLKTILENITIPGFNPATDIAYETNTRILIIEGAEDTLDTVGTVLEMLDIADRQVVIRAQILQHTVTNDMDIGISAWLDKQTKDSGSLFRRVGLNLEPETYLARLLSNTLGTFQGTQLQFATVGSSIVDIGTVNGAIRAIIESGEGQLISSPKIVVTEGVAAKFSSQLLVPIQRASTSGSTISTNVAFESVGPKITVTPLIIGDGKIELQIKTEHSAIIGYTDPAVTGGVASPILNKKSASTRVTMGDGDILIIGGLYTIEQRESHAKVPILGDIPLLKYLFRSHRYGKINTEIMFFLTPFITGGEPVFIPEED